MVKLPDFKKDTWFYALISAILALISIFTPVASRDKYQVWFSGILVNNPDLDPSWTGFGAASIWTLVLTSMCIALLLFYSIHSMKGMKFKWDWLVYLLSGLVMIVFPILMFVFDLDNAFVTLFFGGKLTVGFGGIGILIAGIIAVGAFVVDKFVAGRAPKAA